MSARTKSLISAVPAATIRPWSGGHERSIRAEVGSGQPLPDRLRTALELALQADLGAVRLHDDSAADALAGSLAADAFAAGADVFLHAGALRPDTTAGVELLAHEVVHIVQQASGPCDTGAEGEAVAAARAFAAGRPLPTGRPRVRARPLGDKDPLVLQCHSSWEHRMLGDLRTVDFQTLASGGANRRVYLEQVQQFLKMWQSDPTSVSAESITKRFADIRPLRLAGSGLVVTYGELNTLADYLASPVELDRLPAASLLPILQQVRQEGYSWVTWVMDDNWLDKKVVLGSFEGSVAATLGSETADALWETRKMESHTEHFGPHGIDHYNGLLARNACHFAPHSWYRWEQFYLQAHAYAIEAHHATGARKARLTDLAWLHHGYADHFLHDSFAAGHLVNKTLVMQWYLDWVAPQPLAAVPDWDLVQFMTTSRQPDIAGRSLYSAFANPAARGDVRDPQTASEHWSRSRRMAVAGVRPDGSNVESSYKRWLAFLDNGVVQLASNAVHDHFNTASLMVSSEAQPTPYQLYGDNTMIKGGTGYVTASATAKLSQQSLLDVLETGTASVTTTDIAKHFPTRIHDPHNPASSQSLEDWAYGLQGSTGDMFSTAKNFFVGTLRFRLAPVTIDNVGGWTWTQVQGGQKVADIAVGPDEFAWAVGIPSADGNGNGHVLRRGQAGGTWTPTMGAATRIAVGGDDTVWVVNAAGVSYCRALGKDWEQGAPAAVGGVTGLVDIAAGTDGSAWALARAAGPGGHQLLRCVRVAGTHSWEQVAGGGIAVSVGPDGLPWAVGDDGSVKTLVPGVDGDRWSGPGAHWIDVSPPGHKATDIGVGVGVLLSVWVTTDKGVLGWNGRLPDQPGGGGRLQPDWEDLGGQAVRVATGHDGRPWVLNSAGDVWKLDVAAQSTAAFTTTDAGKVRGTALAVGGSLFQDEWVSINGSTDLSGVIKGNSGAHVSSIKLERSPIPGVFYRLSIDGQGPAGIRSGSMYLYIEDEGGFSDYKQFFVRTHHTLTIDYNGTKAGIRRISWSDGDDPGKGR